MSARYWSVLLAAWTWNPTSVEVPTAAAACTSSSAVTTICSVGSAVMLYRYCTELPAPVSMRKPPEVSVSVGEPVAVRVHEATSPGFSMSVQVCR
jgi:hypothetical protein